MSRRVPEALSRQDWALWRQLAASVRPLRPAQVAAAPSSVPSDPVPAPSTSMPKRPAMAPAGAGAARAPPPPLPTPLHAATLDGAWDRRLASGRVEPELILDLHGHGEDAAHALVERRLAEAAARGIRLVLVITGKGSRRGEQAEPRRQGILRRRLSDWLELARTRPLVAAIRPAHPRHGGGGAFYVVLKRLR